MFLRRIVSWDRALLRRSLFLGLILLSGKVLAADGANISAGLVVYSGLNFIELEGEFVGVQVAIVPYEAGRKVLWRSAGPFVNPPILLDAIADGENFKVIVPDDDLYPGAWTLSLRGNSMIANGPNGATFTLKKLGVK